jgi:hypothetical protein
MQPHRRPPRRWYHEREGIKAEPLPLRVQDLVGSVERLTHKLVPFSAQLPAVAALVADGCVAGNTHIPHLSYLEVAHVELLSRRHSCACGQETTSSYVHMVKLPRSHGGGPWRTGGLPWPAYLGFAVIVAIASVGSCFELTYSRGLHSSTF